MSELELLTIGRVSVDLYAEQLGVPLADVESFAKSIGGSPTNVAVAASRLGRRTAVVTAVGTDDFGDFVRGKLAEFDVDTTYVGSDSRHRTPLAFAVMDPPEDPQLIFYREPSAPDEHIELTERLVDAAQAADMFWVAGSCLAGRSTGPTARAMLAARERRSGTALDLDYRPTMWPSEETARREIGAAIAEASIAVGNRRECEVAVGSADPDVAADELLARGVELAVVKLGAEGVLVATPRDRTRVDVVPVKVVCGLGAGDGFGGALCHRLLAGDDPVSAVRFANAAGAIVASRLLCADAMPTVDEVEGLLESSHVGA